jgi:hypothetical protein
MSVELPTTLVDVETVARFLSVSPDWIYAHADELGARRLGRGPKARLRFSLHEVDERLRSCSPGRDSRKATTLPPAPIRRPEHRASAGTGIALLPIRGREGPEVE